MANSERDRNVKVVFQGRKWVQLSPRRLSCSRLGSLGCSAISVGSFLQWLPMKTRTRPDGIQRSNMTKGRVAYSDSLPTLYEPSQFSVGQIAQSLTCSIMEKPHAGLDDSLNMLLSHWTFDGITVTTLRAQLPLKNERTFGKLQK